ncbi:hypothetical protein MMC25_007291 [Agyrium rufum]|nr:hypothetical protein [Agyrium rufum]
MSTAYTNWPQNGSNHQQSNGYTDGSQQEQFPSFRDGVDQLMLDDDDDETGNPPRPTYSNHPSTNPPYTQNSHPQSSQQTARDLPSLKSTAGSDSGLPKDTRVTGLLPNNALRLNKVDSFGIDFIQLNSLLQQHNPEDGFLLDMNYDPLGPFDGDQFSTAELNHDPIPIDQSTSTSQTTQSSTSVASGPLQANTIAAKQLLSPQLSEITTPESSWTVPSPELERVRLLGGGTLPMSRISSQSTSADLVPTLCENTPALTGTSAEATPEPDHPPQSTIRPPTHPMFRIEQYRRGDSPARDGRHVFPATGKRSRSSSFLDAPTDEDLIDGHASDFAAHPSGPASIAGSNMATTGSRAGLDPAARAPLANEVVANFNDQETAEQTRARVARVQGWLDKNPYVDSGRRRAVSTGDQRFLNPDLSNAHNRRSAEASANIPGPGIVLNEMSESSFDAASTYNDAPTSMSNLSEAPGVIDDRPCALKEQEPDVHKAFNAGPWRDAADQLLNAGEKQPGSSNDAIIKFLSQSRSEDVETSSRKATWGTERTVRRMSDTELERLVGRLNLSDKIEKLREMIERRSSNAAAKLIPRRSSSATKPQAAAGTSTQDFAGRSVRHPSLDSIGEKSSTHERNNSLGSRKESSTTLQRMHSGRKGKSPIIQTGGAVAAIGSSAAAFGTSGPVSPTATSPTRSRGNVALGLFRQISRGEHNRTNRLSGGESGLTEMWSNHGGPPRPTLNSFTTDPGLPMPTSPAHDLAETPTAPPTNDDRTPAIDFTPTRETIIPTRAGFKDAIIRVNPRVDDFLAERLSREQCHRYKKLVKLKVAHATAIRDSKCNDSGHCTVMGGAPTYPLPSKSQKKETEYSHTGFSKIDMDSDNEDPDANPEGLVTQSQFPDGVPMPPVVRLPAKFECPLCFMVKEIKKPSDWSKHVHEDLQPFTCTFPDCTEPKSFKRKADWVRHENERHRQLEWWSCNKPDCAHTCYRRDNFVQHLNREHKLGDGKEGNGSGNGNGKPSGSKNKATRGPGKKTKANANMIDNMDGQAGAMGDEVLDLVALCRHFSDVDPTSESCRFCGNSCTTWKKLTVHLAKHMEQISIPILDMVETKDVTPDTIVSPVEPLNSNHKALSTRAGSVAASIAHNERDGSALASCGGTPTLPPAFVQQQQQQDLPANFTPLQSHSPFLVTPNHTPGMRTDQWGSAPQTPQSRNPQLMQHYPTNAGMDMSGGDFAPYPTPDQPQLQPNMAGQFHGMNAAHSSMPLAGPSAYGLPLQQQQQQPGPYYAASNPGQLAYMSQGGNYPAMHHFAQQSQQQQQQQEQGQQYSQIPPQQQQPQQQQQFNPQESAFYSAFGGNMPAAGYPLQADRDADLDVDMNLNGPYYYNS